MTFIRKRKEEQTDNFQLSVYLMAARNLHPEVKDYEELAKLLDDEFGVKVKGRDIWLLDQPTIDEDELDYRLRYERI